MNMNRITGLALLLVGCGLSYYGWQSHESVASTVSSSVTGAPTDKAMWLLGLGVLTFATGLYALIFRGAR
jgi:hypothetical protein